MNIFKSKIILVLLNSLYLLIFSTYLMHTCCVLGFVQGIVYEKDTDPDKTLDKEDDSGRQKRADLTYFMDRVKDLLMD